MLPPGAPRPEGHWGKAFSEYRPPVDGHFVFPDDEALHDQLPDYYTRGVEIHGHHFPTVPRVMADTSRDQYVRGFPGTLMAYDLLGDDERAQQLKATIEYQLPCTLNRLRRGRITSLTQAQNFQALLTTFLQGGAFSVEEDDLDLTEIDELVFFVMDQPHPDHVDQFDPTCPDGPPFVDDPALVMDAAAPDFAPKFLALAAAEKKMADVPVVFSMHVTARTGDLMYVMQWALTAHYLTGDDVYLLFLEELLEELPTAGILDLYGAFTGPKYCAPHFAPSLTSPSVYNLLARLKKEDAPALWEGLAMMARDEMRYKTEGERRDPYFTILYDRMVDETIDPDKAEYVQTWGVDYLATYGMADGDKLEPDRSYPRDFVTNSTDEVPLESIAPGDPEWALCEEPINVLGVDVPPMKIDGIAVRSVDPLPLDKRIGGTMLWQMDPWMVQRTYGGVGMRTRWPGPGMFVPYWVGRSNDTITEGQGLALAWRDTGTACE